MSALGDRLRDIATLCDQHPDALAAGVIVSANSEINFICEEPKMTEQEAFQLVQRALTQAFFPGHVDVAELERILREDCEDAA